MVAVPQQYILSSNRLFLQRTHSSVIFALLNTYYIRFLFYFSNFEPLHCSYENSKSRMCPVVHKYVPCAFCTALYKQKLCLGRPASCLAVQFDTELTLVNVPVHGGNEQELASYRLCSRPAPRSAARLRVLAIYRLHSRPAPRGAAGPQVLDIYRLCSRSALRSSAWLRIFTNVHVFVLLQVFRASGFSLCDLLHCVQAQVS